MMFNRSFVKIFAFVFCVVGLNNGSCVDTIVLSANLAGACFLIFQELIPQSIDFTSEISIFGLQIIIFNHEICVFGVKTAKFTLLLVN